MHTGTAHLLLLRHGQSEWNVLGKWQGAADPGLTANGYRQAAHAAAALPRHGPFHAVWCSDLQRAATTADLIAAELGLGRAERHPGLREAGLGPWEGLTEREIEQQWPGYLRAYRRPPGAEDHDVVLSRLTHSITHIARAIPAGGNAVVVAHAGVLRMLRRVMQRPDVLYTNLTGYWVHVDQATGGVDVGQSVALTDAPLPESM